MAERVSQADISYQDELWIGRGLTGTTEWTQVFGVETVGMPEKTPEEIDVTHQQSPGRTREVVPGLLTSADMTQELQYWPTDDSQILLDELAGLTEAGTKEDVYVEFVVGGMRRTYRGYVNTYAPSGTVGEKRMANVSFKLFERVTPNPRPVTP